MPFTKAQSDDRPTFATWRTDGEKSSPSAPTGTKDRARHRLRFHRILGRRMGQAVIRGAIEEILKTQSQLLGDHQPCPTVGGPVPWTSSPDHSGPRRRRSRTTSPSVIARPVAGIFFPLRPSLRLDSHGFSPAILGKIVRAAARSGVLRRRRGIARRRGRDHHQRRQVGRIAHEVGEQLRDERDQRVEAFTSKQATPEAPVAPRLAVVSVDGGRLQTRSEEPAKAPASTTRRGARTRSPTC